MWLVRLRKPRAEPRRCSIRPLMASVGPLLVPGRSKYASTSSARFFSVRPRVMISTSGRDADADRVDQLGHQLAATTPVGLAVGRDHPLVDAPGRLDLDMCAVGEQVGEPSVLFVGEQAGAGVQGAPRLVERVALVTAVAVDRKLDPASAAVEGVAGQADHVEGIHHCGRVGQFLGGGGLEAGEAVHRDDLHAVAPRGWAFGEPGLERLLGAALDQRHRDRGR